MCPDAGNSITIIGRNFLIKQAPDYEIKLAKSPIGVRGVGNTPLKTREYAVIDVYIPGQLPDGSAAVGHIRCEAYIIKELSANLLFGADVNVPYGLDVIHSRQKLKIATC